MATLHIEEDYAWEIKFNEERKPFYYNRLSERVLLSRPYCLESSGRVKIREPVIEAQYKGKWYKGILLGPADSVSFAVQLEQGPVQRLDVDRDWIRKWTTMRRHTIPSSAQRGSLGSVISSSDRKEAFLGCEEDESLSKLSDTFSLDSTDEKFDFETQEEKERQFKRQDKESNPEEVLDSRTRSKSWGFVRKQDIEQKYWTDEHVNSDWMNSMLPLQPNPKSDGVGRRQRLNAVLLDLQDLVTIKSTI